MAFGPNSTNPRERRAFAHLRIRQANESGVFEDVEAAHDAILAAGDSRKSRMSGFEDSLVGVARAVGCDIRRYVTTSQELLDPNVRAVPIGQLAVGAYEAVTTELRSQAEQRRIARPLLIADLVFTDEVRNETGILGQPYSIISVEEWEGFAADVPQYCGDTVPAVYMVDGDKYLAPI
jgi:hypothetical protein